MVSRVDKEFEKQGVIKMSSFQKGILHGMFYGTILWAAFLGWVKVFLRYLGYDI